VRIGAKVKSIEDVNFMTFVVTDPNNGMEKWFDVGKRSARLIVNKLKERHRLMRVERSATSKEREACLSKLHNQILF
jgi:hypothetical protein